MKRLVIFCWLVAGAASALILFQIKAEVQTLEQEIAQTQSRILRDQEAVHILEAEWSYLNRPAHIAALAERHLGMAAIPAERVVGFDDLPLPDAPEEDGAQPEEDDRPSTATLVKAPAAAAGGLRQ